MKKYTLTDETKVVHGITVYRIRAEKDFTLINGKEIKKGDLGGWVQGEHNLSHDGRCWVYDECTMFEKAHRSGDSIGYEGSRQYGDSRQFGSSRQFGESRQHGYSQQYGDSRQYGDSQQYGDSRQYGDSQQYGDSGLGSFSKCSSVEDVMYLESPTSGRTISISKNDMSICTGCFSGSIFWLANPERDPAVADPNHWAHKLKEYILNNDLDNIEL